ncbi:PAS domain-containing protein [Lujinxingia vulgaris]|uniref:histidine kinase n=1 Tax=Lujinxingia vulgaris TaxID=2600176 RepID=A0A5C6XG80_9DELT|nr:PAS domain-containing protein [Lujinxingia vulgaris]TXD39463.1 PAS domain-containing protein [Lujinxingia vulgaris]
MTQTSVPTIWIVDALDERAAEIAELLAPLHATLRLYADARKAVFHARRSAPDLVVLGVEECTIPSDEILGWTRQFNETANMPVILVYQDGESAEVVDRAMAHGATDALERVRLHKELLRRVRWRLPTSRSEKGRRDEATRSFEFLERVIHASPNAIVAARRTGEVVLFNAAAQRVLGWSESEAMELNVRELYPPQGAERIMHMLRSRQHGGPGRIESLREEVVDRHGERIPVEISAALVMEDDLEVATVGIFTDLRQRLAMEERLQEAFETLERTQRQAVIAELAGAAAHELNQPLTSLMGYAELLQRQGHSAEQAERAVDTIHQEARRISEIVRKIGRITRYKTKEYAGGELIVDLDEAGPSEVVPTPPSERGDGL